MRHLQNLGLFCDSPWMAVPQHDRRAKFVHLCPSDPTFPERKLMYLYTSSSGKLAVSHIFAKLVVKLINQGL